MLRRTFTLAALASLVACGGGEAQPLTVGLYGDSFSATNPSSTEQIEVFSNHRFKITSYSVGGATTEIARTGIPTNYLPFKDFSTQMAGVDTTSITILRYGIADAARNLNDITTFRNNLIEFIGQARNAGKQIVMINMVSLPETDYIKSSGLTKKLNEFNSVLESVCTEHKVKLLDLRSQIVLEVPDMYEDGLHPTPETTMRINKVIAKLMVEAL